MDKKKVFNILEIQETKDESIIKAAYRKKLLVTNPEDDPEGFKLLREAYEEAIRLSKIEEEEKEDTPVSRWIEKVDSLYRSLSRRNNIDAWEELFQEEVCRNFDTFEEVRDALLLYLMDHFRLSFDIWELINNTYHLPEIKEELYEKFPINFIDFVIRAPEADKWFDYKLFEGKEDGDVDEFINCYYALRRMNDTKEYGEFHKVLDTIEKTNLWHPYLDVEKMIYYMNSNELETAKEIGQKLMERKYDNLFIKYYLMLLTMESGDIEKAYKEAEEIIKESPRHYGARKAVYKYFYKKGDYKQSKEKLLELLEEWSYDQSLIEDLQKVNEHLIEIYKEQIEKEPENKKLKLELGWSLFQNNLFEECLNLIKDMELDDKIYYEYYNLMTRNYMVMENYEQAYPYAKIWLEEILKIKEKIKDKDDADISDENKKIIRRLSLAYYFIAKCYYHFSKSKTDENYIDKCIEYYDLAIETETNEGDLLKFLCEKAQLYLELGKNELCVDVCDRIISKDSGYFLAYVYRQEAFYNLKMGREVLDDYYKAVEIYDGYPKIYILAVKVLIIFERYEEAKRVLDKAKEAGIKSNELAYQELRIKRIKATTKEEKREIADEIKKLYDKVQKEKTEQEEKNGQEIVNDIEDSSVLLYELSFCYYEMDEFDLALKAINERLKVSDDVSSIELKGDILYYLKKYKEAINVFKKLINDCPNYYYGYYVTGYCYEELNNDQKALEYYLKTVELEPEHSYVNHKIKDIYRRWYNKYFKREHYELAVKHAKRQVEIQPNGYYYNELGLIYSDGYEMEKAIEAFKKAVEYDKEDMYPYNNIGWSYKVLGNFDEAYKYYQLALKYCTTNELITHRNLSTYYMVVGEFEKTIELYEEIYEKTENSDFLEYIAYVYVRLKNWEMALAYYKRKLDIDKNYVNQYWLDVGYLYSCKGDNKNAIKFYKKGIFQDVIGSEPYRYMGDHIFWLLRDYKKALKYYKKAYMYFEYYNYDNVYFEELTECILYVLKILGKEKLAKKYFEKTLDYINRKFNSLDSWLNNPNERKERLYYMASWHLSLGEYEKAKEYVEQMKKCLSCQRCSFLKCAKLYFIEGLFLEAEQDYHSALEKYQIALKLDENDIKYIGKVNEMKEKIGEKQL